MTGWLIGLPVSELTLFCFQNSVAWLGCSWSWASPQVKPYQSVSLAWTCRWPSDLWLIVPQLSATWCGDYMRSWNSLDLVLYQCWLDPIPGFLGSQLLPSDLFQGLVTPWCVNCKSASCDNKHCLLVTSFQCQLKRPAFCISRQLMQYSVGDIKQDLVSWAVWFLQN